MKKFLFIGLVVAFLGISTSASSSYNSDLKIKANNSSDQVALVLRRRN